MNKGKRWLMSIIVFSFLCSFTYAQMRWPVESTNNDHPLGNIAGEFQQYGGTPYLHTGHDIREDCAPDGPWVVSVVPGDLTLYDDSSDPTNRYNGVTIVDGTDTYRYWHLDHNSITVDVRNADTDGTTFPDNTRIAQIVDWSAYGSFHHLHFDVIQGTNYINPYINPHGGLNPNGDTNNPVVSELMICRNNSNTFLLKPAAGLWTVDGDLDIIAHIADTDTPLPSITWQGNIGIYRVEYSIQEVTGTHTHNVPTTQLYRFDSFPTAGDGSAVAGVVYKVASPAYSSSNYYTNGGEQSYYIVTNVDGSGNLSEPNGLWDTNGGGFPDGLYQMNVTAYDVVGNHHTRSEIVFVRNNAATPAPVNLLIKDHDSDNGIIPSNPNGEAFWVSPDIRVDAPPFGIVNDTGLPFGSNSHENPIYNQQNRVYVRVHNIGGSTSGNAETHLYWADPSGGIPSSEWSEIDPGATHTVTGIPAGSSGEVIIPWTPTGTAIGHRCLLVRVVSTEDPIFKDYNVVSENNIAQKNVSIINVTPGIKPAPMEFFVSNPFKLQADVGLVMEIKARLAPTLLPVEQYFQLQLPNQAGFVNLAKLNGYKYRIEGKFIYLSIPISNKIIIKGFNLKPGEKVLARVYLPTTDKPVLEKPVLGKPQLVKSITINVTQYVNKRITGGVTFIIKGGKF